MVKGQLLTTVKMSPGFVAWERVQRKRNTAKKPKDEDMVGLYVALGGQMFRVECPQLRGTAGGILG